MDSSNQSRLTNSDPLSGITGLPAPSETKIEIRKNVTSGQLPFYFLITYRKEIFYGCVSPLFDRNLLHLARLQLRHV